MSIFTQCVTKYHYTETLKGQIFPIWISCLITSKILQVRGHRGYSCLTFFATKSFLGPFAQIIPRNRRPIQKYVPCLEPGWQKLCEGRPLSAPFLFRILTVKLARLVQRHKGPLPKSLDLDENLSPHIRYFVAILRFVAIYALFGRLWTNKSAPLDQ